MHELVIDRELGAGARDEPAQFGAHGHAFRVRFAFGWWRDVGHRRNVCARLGLRRRREERGRIEQRSESGVSLARAVAAMEA